MKDESLFHDDRDCLFSRREPIADVIPVSENYNCSQRDAEKINEDRQVRKADTYFTGIDPKGLHLL